MMVRRDGRKRGQSLLEYLIVVMVIVAAILAFAQTLLRPAVEKSMTDSKGVIERSSTKVGQLVP